MATKQKTETVSAAPDIAKLQADLFTLSMKHKAGELKETHKLKLIRKEIARAKTALSQNTL